MNMSIHPQKILVKYCEAAFNPLEGCLTLQLGTATYYREMDPSYSIADEQEGQLNYIVDSPGIFGLQSVRNISSNAYLFCVSTEDMSMEEARMRFGETYNSRYYIHDAEKFSRIVAEHLVRQLTIDDYSNHNKKDLMARQQELSVHHYHGPVRYEDMSFIQSEDPNYIFSLGEFELYKRSHFCKRLKYQNDAEYRFLFTVQEKSGEYLISVAKKPKILTFTKKDLEECLSNENPV